MIVVDTSVWVALLRNDASDAVRTLREVRDPGQLIVGDLVLLECLQGARNDAHSRQIEARLRAFRIEPMLDPDLAVDGARNYRALRAKGITPRKTVDLVIASYCIRHGHRLLHQDRDFDPMVAHLGLRLA